jgi:hypothetical protein
MSMLDDSDRRRADEETIDLSQIEDAERDADEELISESLRPAELADVSFCAPGETMSLSTDKTTLWSGVEEAADEDEEDPATTSRPLPIVFEETGRMAAGCDSVRH